VWLGKGREVVKPWPGLERAPEKFLIVFTGIGLGHAEELLESVEVVEDCTYVYRALVGDYRGEKICVLNPYFGAPASVFALELAIASGGRYFIMVGEAGAIKEGIHIGDVILPTWALREEGTSYHYMPPEYTPRPSEKLLSMLEEEIKRQIGKRRIGVFRGGVWTTDAPFRETEDKVKEYAKRGILGVEMEGSALMSVAEFRGVELAVALAVSDELYRGEWNVGFGSEKLRRTEELLVKSALEVLVNL